MSMIWVHFTLEVLYINCISRLELPHQFRECINSYVSILCNYLVFLLILSTIYIIVLCRIPIASNSVRWEFGSFAKFWILKIQNGYDEVASRIVKE